MTQQEKWRVKRLFMIIATGLYWDMHFFRILGEYRLTSACLARHSIAPVDHLYFYHLLDKGSHFQLKFGGISSDEQLQCPQETMRLLLCAWRSSSYQTVPTEASCHLQKGENPTNCNPNPWHYYICMENPELASRACLQHSILKTWA